MDEPPPKKACQEPLEDAGNTSQPMDAPLQSTSPARAEPQAGISAALAGEVEPEPGTSAASAGEEPPPLEDPLFNESLDAFAQRYKLSALNVKNIIYHVVKNPKTFATVIAKDPEAIASLRLTRGRLKELKEISKAEFGIELRPIDIPKTFLDVEYGEDEEDAEYEPGESDEDEEQEDEADVEDEQDEEEEPGPQKAHTDADTHHPTTEATESLPLQSSSPPGAPAPIATKDVPVVDEAAAMEDLLSCVDTPEYWEFLNGVLGPDTSEPFNEEDADDAEYNVCQDPEEGPDFGEDEDEYREDRTTKVPRWELEGLFMDLFTHEEILSFQRARRRHSPDRATNRPGSGFSMSRGSVEPEPSTSTQAAAGMVGTTLDSWSLLDNSGPPKFSAEELATLKVQMEKHVQLLTQAVVGTCEDRKLVKVHNQALKMMHDIDEKARESPDNPLLNACNFDAAVLSSHDILECGDVQLPEHEFKTWETVSHPSPKTMCVLARSGALVYPKILPTTPFYACAQYHSVFLPSEQLLLAMGLVALRHVRHSNWNFCRGKYALISENFLPNKTVMQIRNFKKNARGSKPNPLHQIDAYKEGVFVAEIRTDSDETAQTDIPLNWPEHVQPGWLKTLSRLHREGRIDVLAPTPTLCTALPRPPSTQLYFTPQPTLSSAMGSRTASPIVDVVGSGRLLRSTVVSESQNDEGGAVGVDGYVVVDGTADMEGQPMVQLAQEPQPLMLSLPDHTQQGPLEFIVAQMVQTVNDQGQVVLELVNEGVLVPSTSVEEGRDGNQGLGVEMTEFFDATTTNEGRQFEGHSVPEQPDRRPEGMSGGQSKSPEYSRPPDPDHLDTNQAAASPFSPPGYHYDDGGAPEAVHGEEWDHESVGGSGPPSYDDDEKIDVVRSDEPETVLEVSAHEAIETPLGGHTDLSKTRGALDIEGPPNAEPTSRAQHMSGSPTQTPSIVEESRSNRNSPVSIAAVKHDIVKSSASSDVPREDAACSASDVQETQEEVEEGHPRRQSAMSEPEAEAEDHEVLASKSGDERQSPQYVEDARMDPPDGNDSFEVLEQGVINLSNTTDPADEPEDEDDEDEEPGAYEIDEEDQEGDEEPELPLSDDGWQQSAEETDVDERPEDNEEEEQAEEEDDETDQVDDDETLAPSYPTDGSSYDQEETVEELDEDTPGSSSAAESDAVGSPRHKTAKKMRLRRGIEALMGADGIRESSRRALVAAVYEDIEKRLFIHQDKLRQLKALLARRDIGRREIMKRMVREFKDVDAHVVWLLTALTDDIDLDLPIRIHPSRVAYKKALEMIEIIQTYMTGSRKSAAAARVAFKVLKQEDITSEEQLREKLHKCFAIRDGPLWRALRQYLGGEKFTERVDPRSFEVIDLEKFKSDQQSRAAWASGGQRPGPSPKTRGAELRFEHVELPYRPDATEKDRLRVRAGRITMSHGGKLKRVHVGFASERTDGSHLLMATPWTRDDDMRLLLTFNKFGGDPQKTVEGFLTSQESSFSALETSRRLSFLLSLINKVSAATRNRRS